MTRVFLGISLGEENAMYDKTQITKLWIHESERVFSDRLLEHDIINFKEIISAITKSGFQENYKTVTNNEML